MSYTTENWQDFQWSFHKWKFKNKENFFKKAKIIARELEEDFSWESNEIIIPHQKVRFFYSEEPIEYTEEKVENIIQKQLKTSLEWVEKLKNDDFFKDIPWLWKWTPEEIEKEIRDSYKDRVGTFWQKGITIDFILESNKPEGFKFAEFFFLLHNHMTRYMWYFTDKHFLEKIHRITEAEINDYYQYNEKFQDKIYENLPTFTFDLGS